MKLALALRRRYSLPNIHGALSCHLNQAHELRLEMAFVAKQYLELGYDTEDWLENIGKALETESAKKLFTVVKNTSFNNWWKNK